MGLNWSPDGQSLLFVGFPRPSGPPPSPGERPEYRVYQLDPETGTRSSFVGYSEGACAPGSTPSTRRVIQWADWSGDGQGIYYLCSAQGQGGLLMHRDLRTGQDRTVVQFPSIEPFEQGMTLSPNRGLLARGVREGLTLIPLEGGDRRDVRLDQYANWIAWMPDGQHLVVRTGPSPLGPGSLWWVPLDSGEPRKLDFGSDTPGVLVLDAHPTEPQIAIATGSVTFQLWVMENFLPESQDDE